MRSHGSSRNISILPELIDANLLSLDGHVMQKVIWAGMQCGFQRVRFGFKRYSRLEPD
jgi:hypothetical protein